MVVKGKVLNEIRLQNLALPKNQIREPSHFGYSERKPHGAEFWIRPGEIYRLQRNIVYQLEEEGAIEVLQEMRSDLGYEGVRFIVKVHPKFDEIFKKHDKGVKIVKRLETEGLWVQANFEGEEIHLFVGEKEDDGKHMHLILGKSGEVRVDEKDKAPGDLVKKVIAITTRDDKEIKAVLEFEKKEKKDEKPQ